jgi:hypothetical protein
MENILHVEGNPSLVRDLGSNAIVNTNKSEFETYLRNRDIMLGRVNQVQVQNEKINKLENDINDIKSMLQQLINKEN